MPLIHLEHVSVSYGKRKALRDFTCDIEHGAVGLLGLNGAGKSTLLKTLLGFLRADRGSVVEMFGMRMPRYALKARQHLGYMPERDIVSPKVSAVAFLCYCGSLYGMGRVDAMERAHEVLNYVRMGSKRYQKMETYSTGLRQRVKFAQALIHDPKLLLLDEPTSGLDPDGRTEMLRLIRELAVERQVAILLSTHLLPDVDAVCDRVVMVHEGELVRDSSIQDLKSETEGAYEVEVTCRHEAFRAGLEDAGYAYEEMRGDALMVQLTDGASEQTVFEIARAAGTHVRHFQAVRQSLEDVFLRTIGSKG